MNIIIDGQTIVLTPAQAKQFRDAVLKETSVAPEPKNCGNITLSCKKAGKATTYPLMITSSFVVPAEWGRPIGSTGKDFSLAELKTFIKSVKEYAAQIWTTAGKELKNV